MKAECYLRVARKPRARWNESQFVFEVSQKEPANPLYHGGGAIRTAVIKLNLELPPEVFGPAAEVDITVPASSCKVLASV